MRRRGGFSLLELLVSVGIFVVITTAVTLNFRSGERSSQLRIGAETVASTIRTLQTMTQSGRVTKLCANLPHQVCGVNAEVCGGGACVDSFPQGGYGLAIQNRQFVAFADGNKNFTADLGEELPSVSIDLPAEVELNSADTDIMSLAFEPPDGRVWINGVNTLAEGRIELRHNQLENATRQIIIRAASGRVEIID